MSMAVGSVSITGGWDGSGSPTAHRTGTGLALAMFDAMVAAKAAQTPAVPPVAPPLGGYDVSVFGGAGPNAPGFQQSVPVTTANVLSANAGRLAYFKDLAGTCNGIAAIVLYIQNNASISAGTFAAHVTSQSLGVTPNPNNAATPIDAPGAPVDIPLTGAGVIT